MLLLNSKNFDKQIDFEQFIRADAKNMIQDFSSKKKRNNKRLLLDAQKRLMTSKNKLEILYMKSMKIKKIISNQPPMDNMLELSREESEATTLDDFDGSYSTRFTTNFVPSQEVRRALLKYKVNVETRVMQGAKSIIKVNRNDRESVQTVSFDGKVIN